MGCHPRRDEGPRGFGARGDLDSHTARVVNEKARDVLVHVAAHAGADTSHHDQHGILLAYIARRLDEIAMMLANQVAAVDQDEMFKGGSAMGLPRDLEDDGMQTVHPDGIGGTDGFRCNFAGCPSLGVKRTGPCDQAPCGWGFPK